MQEKQADNIRNVAIIAHVDHGKTTLVDQLLRQGGAFRANQQVDERVMDSMDLEKEKGITIKAKNTSVHWEGHIINIVDTPGHADFGAEVERVMKMVDGVLLLVDALDGPQAQTRFVLSKALANGLHPVVVINKADREHARPEWVHDKVLELFLELEATEEQFNAPFLYASAKEGWACNKLSDPHESLIPLFEAIMKYIPAPRIEEGSFRMLASNIEWNDFVGRIAVGKILSGSVSIGDIVYRIGRDGTRQRSKISKVFGYSALQTLESGYGEAGDIVGISGFDEVDIGETFATDPDAEPVHFIDIDPPTIEMEFAVNDGPLAGREGKLVTSRQIRERLTREMKTNISLRMKEGPEGTRFTITARGAMQIAILVEQMRREGYEVLVSRPTVIYKEDAEGRRLEPYERIWVDVDAENLGAVLEALARRKARIEDMRHYTGGVNVEAVAPTRGLIGFEFDLANQTSGRGVMSRLFDSYGPYVGDVCTRQTGVLVSMENGQINAYALDSLQDRGRIFVSPGDDVYAGMLVGENPRKMEMPVNPTKAKQMTNVRASGRDKNIMLAPPLIFSLERAIEYIEPDEYVEATPKTLRLRKRILDANERRRLEKKMELAEVDA
ncbi:MAG: translational GTPase TypA [Opitutales bacterium]|nr:translational GTPase TypA [Opitutales bacterium]